MFPQDRPEPDPTSASSDPTEPTPVSEPYARSADAAPAMPLAGDTYAWSAPRPADAPPTAPPAAGPSPAPWVTYQPPADPTPSQPIFWDGDTVSTVATVPVSTTRRRRGGSRATLLVALCLISGVSGGAVALGAVALTGNNPAAAAPNGTPNAVNAAAVTSPSATFNPAAVSNQESSTIQIAATVAPAVVTIQVGGTPAANNSPLGGQGGGQVSGTGSGVLISSDGWILTNHHVVSTAKTVTVILSDGRQFDGTVKGVDTLTDFAIVKVDATGLPAATLGDSAGVQVGQTAIAIGSPLGEFPGSVTEGIVSGLDRSISVADAATQLGSALRHLIQTDAAINPGNSGGALLNSQGQVIGINTAEASQAQSIGFALPIDLAKPIIAQAEAGQTITRPWIGILYRDLDAQVAKDNNLSVNQGAWIHKVQGSNTPAIVAGSPAETAGLKDGDIITALDTQTIDATHPLDLLLLGKQPGDKVTLTVLRGSSTTQIDLTLGTRPASLGVAGGLG